MDEDDAESNDEATLCDAGDGLLLDVGDYTISDDGCQNCSCNSDRSLICSNVSCPALPRRCPFGEPLHFKYECCPVCPMGAYDIECGCYPDEIPVCGANGKSYLNPCEADCKNENYTRMLCAMDCPCAERGNEVPVCGADGQTYSSACEAVQCANVQVATEGPCGSNFTAPIDSSVTAIAPVVVTVSSDAKMKRSSTVSIVVSLLAVLSLSGIAYVIFRRRQGILFPFTRRHLSHSPAWRQLTTTSEQFLVGGHGDESGDED
eukprot:m.683498 g.683498  ORF g.683498 m.683498 type:complete len:262 (+) comp22829_c0_seq7:728-1513(+)